MRGKSEKQNLLELLSEMPNISYASKKLGIARSTINRWKKDPKTGPKIENAITEGREKMVDVCEMGVLNKAKGGDLKAMIYILAHNSDRYRPTKAVEYNPTPEKINVHPGQFCNACGQRKEYELPDEDMEKIYDNLRNYGMLEGTKWENKNSEPDDKKVEPNLPEVDPDKNNST